jgi:UDP-N-acetylglucosamine--N-acetylmuramyl-(pentapeptide) pyrophosphoryl-undecaprenol N-acetylglucosamine transferase
LTTLLVASTGGHLKQLHQLHRRLSTVSGPYVWATFDTPQSRSLLDDEEVEFVPFVGGRDVANVARNLPHARRILKQREVDTMVSTGSAVALPFYVVGRARRLRCHYIESAARSVGPSLTGKLIARIPGVHLYCQWPAWADGRWRFRGSVFDAFTGAEREDAMDGPPEIRKVVVTLGTYKDFGFPLLIERLLELLPAEAEVLWQTGETDISGFPIEGHHAIPERTLTAAMANADLVIAHAGVGAALAAFEVGKCPVLVPRRLSRNEHIDDHQIQIAAELGDRGVAVVAEVDELDVEDLQDAAKMEVVRLSDPPPVETDA